MHETVIGEGGKEVAQVPLLIQVRAVSAHALELLQGAADLMDGSAGARVEVVFTGTDPQTVARAGELAVFAAEAQGPYNSPRQDPEITRRDAEGKLRKGGSMVRLTLLGEAKTEPLVVASLLRQRVKDLHAQRVA